MGFCVASLISGAVLCVTIILLRKRELVAFFQIILWLTVFCVSFVTVSWVSMQSVIVAFPAQTPFRFIHILVSVLIQHF